MAEEEDGPKYIFITENQEEKSSSRNYNGKAVAKYPNGDVYDGQYINGIREGHGVYRYANGEKYEGEWLRNKKHGIGRMSYMKKIAGEDGDKSIPDGEYNGFWENGRRHGEGVFQYKNGDMYSGWWKHGEKEGTGSYVFKSTGMKLFGEWKAGNISTGRWVYPNGMYYEGTFKNNKPEGKGEWVFKNGNKLDGNYSQKEKELTEEEQAEVDAKKEAGENVPKQYTINWQSNSNIMESASKVNSVE